MSFLSGIGDLLKQYSGDGKRQCSRCGTALRPGSAGGALFHSRQRAWPKPFAPDKLLPFRRWPRSYSPTEIVSNRRAC